MLNGLNNKKDMRLSLRRLRSVMLVLFISLAVSACTTKVAYRFLDWVIAWSVDDYVDWDRQQQADFDLRIENLLVWHQETQLPQYSLFLGQLQQDFQQPLTPVLLQQRLDEMGLLWNQLLLSLEPDVVALLETLSDQQVVDMRKALDKATAKIEKKYADTREDKLDEERIEGLEKFLGRFVGRLSDEQKAIVKHWGDSVEDSREQWINSRKQWAEEFLAALAMRQSAGFAANINILFVQPQSLWNDEYLRLTEVNTTHAINMIIALQPTLTEKQWREFNKEMDQWKKICDELAAEISEANRAVIPL